MIFAVGQSTLPIFSKRPVRERGAALFVALMLLIILSLLAVSASQVVVLQERMSAAYWSDMDIFEVAEANLKLSENNVRQQLQVVCANVPSAENPVDVWATDGLPAGQSAVVSIENLGRDRIAGGVQGSRAAGRRLDGAQCSHFRVSVANVDDVDSPTTRSILQTTFIP